MAKRSGGSDWIDLRRSRPPWRQHRRGGGAFSFFCCRACSSEEKDENEAEEDEEPQSPIESNADHTGSSASNRGG
jgi:hypothetical protein